jgi:hypothetical protein
MNKIAIVSVLLASAGSSSVFALTTTADIDATAGLQSVLSMTCTPVRFGVWKVPVRSGGTTTAIEVGTASDTAFASGNTTGGVAMSATAGYGSARGVCTVTGSSAPDATAMTISIPTATTNLASDSASLFTGLLAPTTAVTGMTAVLTANLTSSITSGGTTFFVGGTLTIPAIIVAANYGAYKTGSPIVITVDDLQ